MVVVQATIRYEKNIKNNERLAVSKFKIHKTKDYTTMYNFHFKEREMSLKAKGLLSLMLSLPENWDYSEKGLATLSKDGVGSTAKALDELEEFGYLKRTQLIETNGKFAGYDYDIYEIPQLNSPYTENPFTEKPFTENCTQLNTNISDNNLEHNTILENETINKKTIEISKSVSRIFEHWKTKGLFPQEQLTETKQKAIDKALKTYTEENLISAIDNYAIVILDTEYFMSTKWYIETFLTQKNALPKFTNDGEKWLNYLEWKENPKKPQKPAETYVADYTKDFEGVF